MLKNYNQLLYPNPFRYREFKNVVSKHEIFDEVRERLDKYILTPQLDEISPYVTEFGDVKSELKIIRFFRFLIEQRIDALFTKIDLMFKKRKLLRLSKFLTTPFRKQAVNEFEKQIENLTDVETYQKGLRYDDLPVQPQTDK